MFTQKHKKLIDQLKPYHDSRNKEFNLTFFESSYPFHIKDLDFPGSLLYLGENFILIELFWRNHCRFGKNEVCSIIYSILTTIAWECETKFVDGLNPDVIIKSITVNGSPISDIEFLEWRDNVYSIIIDYKDLNNEYLLRDIFHMYSILITKEKY